MPHPNIGALGECRCAAVVWGTALVPDIYDLVVVYAWEPNVQRGVAMVNYDGVGEVGGRALA